MSGMLWAALGGASRAGMQIMDDREKAQAKEEVRKQSLLDDDRKRVQSIADRQDALKYEMDLKVEYAKSERETEVQALERADVRASEIRDARGSREFKGGVGMLSSLEEMGISPDTALQTAKDRMAGARETGAPGAVRKVLTDDFNTEVKAENARQKEAARDARDEAREAEREASQARVFAQQDKIQGRQHSATLAAVGARGSGGGGGREDDKPESVTTLRGVMNDIGKDRPKLEDFRGNVKKHADALSAWNQSDQGVQYKELQEAIKARTTAPKPVTPQSTKKDNQTTASKGITQAEFDALPKGAKFVNPKDGKTYRKN